MLSEEELAAYRRAAEELIAETPAYRDDPILNQRVNVWQKHTIMRQLTLHPRLLSLAEKLSGQMLRLWHDQLLVKNPNTVAATEFHQDQPYWPHADSRHPLTVWIALVDIPVERGCMTFLPGSHQWSELPRQELDNPASLFELWPDLRFAERVTLPLRAGDLTFHHGRTAHYAHGNTTGEARLAHAIIYVEETTRFSGGDHVMTRHRDLEAGEVLPDDDFPPAHRFADLRYPDDDG